MQIIFFAIIFIAGFLTTPLSVLFYDQPEYLRIISTHSFWQVFSLGHFPIHQSFWGRLARNRIDYGDVGSWAWAIITNHRDPTGWIYKDARGIWLQI